MLGLGSDEEGGGGVSGNEEEEEEGSSRLTEEAGREGDWVLEMRRKVTKIRRMKREAMNGYLRSFNMFGIFAIVVEMKSLFQQSDESSGEREREMIGLCPGGQFIIGRNR